MTIKALRVRHHDILCDIDFFEEVMEVAYLEAPEISKARGLAERAGNFLKHSSPRNWEMVEASKSLDDAEKILDGLNARIDETCCSTN